jgi:FK506-binding nuclear protein
MGFFGEILGSENATEKQPREVMIPPGFSLTLLMATLELPCAANEVVTVYMQPNAESCPFIICHLSMQNLQCNLMQELAPEDGPLKLFVKGSSKVHITGRWGYAPEEDSDEESCGSECSVEHDHHHHHAHESDLEEEEEDADVRIDRAIKEEMAEATRKQAWKNVLDAHKSTSSVASEGSIVETGRKRKSEKEDLKAGADTSVKKGKKDKDTTTRLTADHKGTSANSKWKPTSQDVAELANMASRVQPIKERLQVDNLDVLNKKRGAWKVKGLSPAPVSNARPHVIIPVPKQIETQGGVLITEYVVGSGAEPKLGSKVKMTYEGMFTNGKVFDKNLKQSRPLVFRKGTGEVVRGLDLGLQGMRVGGCREIVVPPELG